MPETESGQRPERVLIDAGVFIGALLKGDLQHAEARHDSAEAAQAVRLVVEPPSAIIVLSENLNVALKALELAAKHQLTARRVHDTRHAATALSAGISSVYTYDVGDWRVFETDGLRIIGPPSTMERLS